MGCFDKLKKCCRELVFPPGTTHISTMYLLTIAFSSISFSMILTMPFAFLPSMIKSFGYPEKDVGSNAGMVAASYYAGQTLASYFWGWLCDRIGTKNSHMISTALSVILTIVFGISENIEWAIGIRLSQGLVGAILVTLKSSAFRVCDKTNNGIAYSIIISSYSIGLVIGPALGGYLAYPCKQFPSLCSKRSIFETFPFLFPNLVCSVSLFASLFLSYFFMPGTKRTSPKEDTALLKEQFSNSNEKQNVNDDDSLRFAVYDSVIIGESFTVISMESSASSSDVGVDGKQIGTVSYFHIDKNINYKQTSGIFARCCMSLRQSSFVQLVRSKDVVVSIGLYAIISFVNIGFNEVLPVYADSPQQYGGLQFTASEIGRALLLAAIPIIFATLTFPRLSKKFGNGKVVIWTYLILVFCMPLFPFVSFVKKSHVWTILVLSIDLIRYCITANVFCINLLMNNSAPPKLIGAVNGLGMTVSCFCRALSPATLGPLYTWSLGNEGRIGYPFNHCFSFVLMGFVCFLSLFLVTCIPPENFNKCRLIFKDDEIQSKLLQNDYEEKSSKTIAHRRKRESTAV